jgi:MFS family permease
VQTAITLFLLVMAALMITGSKLSDRWGRKRCFTIGLAVYGVGALLSAISPGLGVLILGNSLLEGVGSALLIPPVYILTTLLFTDLQSRARAFGRISGMGGVGAATGPLIGGLITTAISWRAALGISFVVSVFLQTVRGYNAIQTGVIFTAATVGILVSSLGAERFAGRRTQKSLILAGFVTTIVGIGLLIGLVSASDSVLAFVPGLLLIGLGVGVMLTPSVNLVQSAFPEEQQGEISGLSRSVSNLGSSLGTAIAGTILVSDLAAGTRSYALAMASLAVIGLIGLGAALLLPSNPMPQQA